MEKFQNQLKPEEIEEVFNEIKTGIKCVSFGGRILYFKYPSSKILSEATLLESRLKIEWSGKVPRSEELFEYFSDGKYNIKELEFEKTKIVSAINKLTKKSKDASKDPNIQLYKEELDNINFRIAEFNRYKSLIEKASDLYSLDSRINNQIIVFLLKECTYYEDEDENKKLFFKHFDFSNEIDSNKVITDLLIPFCKFRAGYSEKDMRMIAKNAMVSNLYNISASTGSPMFPGSVSEYTRPQMILLFWCRYYYNVMKNLGWPEDSNLVEDDAAFDKWVKDKIDDMGKPSTENKSSGPQVNRDLKTQRHKINFGKNGVRAG